MKKQLLSYLLLLLFLCLLWFGESNFTKSREALTLWFEALVPSMLCVMVLVRVIFAYRGFHIIAKPLAAVFSKALHISTDSFAYVVAMMLLGFPAGAAFVNDEVKKGCLSQQEGARLLYSCSFATPGFIIMTLGNVVFHDIKIGLLLFLIQICSGLILLFFTRKQPIKACAMPCEKSVPFAKTLAQAITDSGITLYMMGGYLMLCMSATAIITQALPQAIRLPVQIITEFSSGCMLISKQALPLDMSIILISMLLSFAGLCVHMQVACMSDRVAMSYPKYFCYRILQAGLSAALAYFLLAL